MACAHATVVLHVEGERAWWRCRTCDTPFAPVTSPTCVDLGEAPGEYLSVEQLSKRIPYSPGSIRNMISKGIFRLGEHYEKPNGGRPVFLWSKVQEWIASTNPPRGGTS